MKVVRKTGKIGLDKVQVQLKDLGSAVGKVGWFETAKYETGTPVAYVASIQEFGSPENNIPPRPFMRPTISENRGSSWKALVASGSKAILAGNTTARNVMEALGLRAAGDIKKTISEVYSPPLKQATIDARLRKHANKSAVGNLTKPLVDTGLMISTVTNTVESK